MRRAALNKQRQTWTAKQQELKQLMDRAGQSAGGAFMNVLAYGADYQSASEELRLIEHAAQAKTASGGQTGAKQLSRALSNSCPFWAICPNPLQPRALPLAHSGSCS